MKYWWLKKYQNLGIKQLPDLLVDIRYFLVMPKNYLKRYEKSENISVQEMKEQELLICLYGIVSSKNIKDSKLIHIIERLLVFPDNTLPISDYTLKEIIKEIAELKKNIPIAEKMDSNNVAACYHCLQVFYVDSIHSVNKKGYCLCPYCLQDKLYFDNDYIPMNYSFLKLATLYYGTSNLGCKFKDIQRILKKHVVLQMGDNISTDTVITSTKKKTSKKPISLAIDFQKLEKIRSSEEAIILKSLFDSLSVADKMMEYETTLLIEKIPQSIVSELSFLILLSLMETLSKMIYLKTIHVTCSSLEMYQTLKQYKKIIEQSL